MADYTQFTWVEGTTQVGPTRMNALEAGVNDAAEHHKQVQNESDIPAASAANKNWIYHVWTTGELFANLTGTAFERVGVTGGGMRGDGSDGTVSMDGTNTYAAFASKAGNVYTLTRDVYATHLTVGTLATLNTQGYRIFCTGAFTNQGIVQNNGAAGLNAASGTAARAGGVGGAATIFAGGGAGGAGGNNAVGVKGVDAGSSQGGSGGVGSAGGANAGGAVGAATLAVGGVKRALPELIQGFYSSGLFAALGYLAGGGGGGGGGSAVAGTAGGSGGGGGGIVAVICGWFDNSIGTMQANGGAGGSSAVANVGRGGGGGGGSIHIIYAQEQDFGTLLVNGGAAGGAGAGAGSAGNIVKVKS